MCGIFGITGHAEASNLTYLGLHALQHRGQESAGIVSAQNGGAHGAPRDGAGRRHLRRSDPLAPRRQLGDRSRALLDRGRLPREERAAAAMALAGGKLAVAHNGNLINAQALRAELEQAGRDLPVRRGHRGDRPPHRALARRRPSRSGSSTRSARCRAPTRCSSSPTTTKLIAVRDPFGFRPLVLGKLKGAYVLASETTAFDLIEAEFVREVEPGEMVVIDEHGLRSTQAVHARCRPAAASSSTSTSRGPTRCSFGQLGLRRAQEARPPARERAARRGGSGDPGARLRRARGDRLRAAERHPLRRGPDPQPLRRPHVHRAAAVDPPLRREAEAHPRCARCSRASAWSSSTTRSCAAPPRARS